MGIHGLFEGIAFGMGKDDVSTANLLVAILCHKWSEALTIGVSFVSADIDKKTSMYYLIFFSLITPIGIGLGFKLSQLN